MRSTLNCLILGLGLVIFCTDGRFRDSLATKPPMIAAEWTITPSPAEPESSTIRNEEQVSEISLYWEKFISSLCTLISGLLCEEDPLTTSPSMTAVAGTNTSDMDGSLTLFPANPNSSSIWTEEQMSGEGPPPEQLSTAIINHDVSMSGDGIFCGLNAIPYNSSTCICEKGYKKVPRKVTVNGFDEFSCEKIPLHCQTDVLTENNNVEMCLNPTRSNNLNNVNSSYCAFIEDLVKSACDNNSSVTISLENQANIFEKHFSGSLQTIKAKQDRISNVTSALEALASTALKRALKSPNEQLPAVVINLTVIQTGLITEKSMSENKAFRLEAQGDQMSIHPRAIADHAIEGPIAVAFISFGGLGPLEAEGTFLQNEILPGDKELKSIHMNSRIVSASTSSLMRNIFIPINVTFNHLKDKIPQEKVVCVHWNSESESRTWSPEGCHHLYSNTTHSECSCQYLSNFAVLMATVPIQEDLILFMISYIGLIISIICLFLSIVTFFLCRAVQNRSTFIHLQLSLCLFFADLLFIVGIDKTYNKILCSVIAGILQYLFLACFVWMFLEGVNLYLIVRNLKVANYSGASKKMKISMYFCGYGLPALIVAISAATVPEGYGTHKHCWLHIEKGFIWSFMGPVCAIIAINLVLFCLILMNLRKKVASLNTEVSTLRNTRSLMLKAVAHVFILGVTWCLGLFQYGPMAAVMAYLFTITNSVQGIFIFLVHCLLNKKVRETYQRWICCGRDVKPPVSDMTLSSVPVSSPMKTEQTTSSAQQQSVEWGKEP